ncbi:MAG: helix-turn-helix transcriptional regulator, partial [Alphaproteobacteria bacterium]
MQEGASASGEFILPAMENANAAQLFRQLFRCMTAERAASSELQRQELLLRLLPALIDRPREGGAAPSAPVAIRMAQAMIDDAPLAAVTLAHLAAATGLSRFQVLRGFSRVTGLTPHAYLMQRRTDLARRLIAGGSGLADAAIASGFADQSHMTRLFVRKYGIAPGAYAAALA